MGMDITCCVGNMIFWWIGVIHGNMSRHFQCFCVSQSLNKEGDIKSCCKWIFGVFWEKLLRSILRKNKKSSFQIFQTFLTTTEKNGGSNISLNTLWIFRKYSVNISRHSSVLSSQFSNVSILRYFENILRRC